MIFGLKSDKVRKDAISKGNSLTFQQVYDLAKTEESTKAQMQVIKQGDENTKLFSVRSKKKAASYEGSKSTSSSTKGHSAVALNTTAHLSASQSSNLNSVVVSDVETNMIATLNARLHMLSACTARKQGTSRRCALRNVSNKSMKLYKVQSTRARRSTCMMTVKKQVIPQALTAATKMREATMSQLQYF